MKPLQQYFHVILFIKYVVLTFEAVNEILWCYHSIETSSAVLSHGTICLVCSSNFCVCGWNPMVLPFKRNLFGTTFAGCYLFLRILGKRHLELLWFSFTCRSYEWKGWHISWVTVHGIGVLHVTLYVKSWSSKILIEKWKHVTWMAWFIWIVDIFLLLPSPLRWVCRVLKAIHFERKMNVCCFQGDKVQQLFPGAKQSL